MCPLIIKLLAPALPQEIQKAAAQGVGDVGQGNTYGGPSEFAVNVRLNRVIALLCSRYFDCLVSSMFTLV